MKQIFTIVLLTICIATLAQKQLKQDRKRLTIFKKKKQVEHLIEPDTQIIEAEPLFIDHSRQNCLWPQPGFKVINYKSELVYTISPENQQRAIPSDSTKSERKTAKEDAVNLSGYTNRIIETKKEFKPFSDYINLEIDWKKEKIVFYTDCYTYKHGKLDSDYILMGMAISAEGKTLCLGYRSTFYGVCQGVAQMPEWYSFETNTYAIVIPNTVETITSNTCHYGPDCSEIP